MSLLDVADLSVRYDGKAALDNVSISVTPGEIVALLGPSGSGKSTLALAAMALLPPTAEMSGTVRIEGIDLATLSERGLEDVRGTRIGMVFQEPATALNPALSIGGQIGEVLARHTGLSRAATKAEVMALLDRVGLRLPPSRFPHTLSGGQRQRVAVAMAIAANPALLIADEPTASLDPLAEAGIAALLTGLVRERGMGLLFVTHDLALATGIADRMVVLDRGHVVEQGRAASLLAAPATLTLRRMAAALAGPIIARSATPGEEIVQLRNVSRSYGAAGLFGGMRTAALADINLTLRRGETLGVVGESGSGKSTLGRVVLGLDRPNMGEVLINGQSWDAARGKVMRAMRRKVQAVFQDPAASFDPRMTVSQIVAEPLHLLATPADHATLVRKALAQVGLPAEAADRLPDAFSGGQRQRIAIARALILRPEVIVLDEALTALDLALRTEMVDLLTRLQAELGMSYLFISHDLRLVRRITDRVLVLRQGRVVEEGPAERIFAASTDPYTAAFVASAE